MAFPSIFVSSGTFKMPTSSAVEVLANLGIARIELSGGVHQAEIVKYLMARKHQYQFQIHNYFPPPAEPFVFNLSDPDSAQRERSIRFACSAIDLSWKLGSTVYSMHAGFLGTPPVQSLGRAWGRIDRIGIEEGLELFCDSVERINAFAQRKGVSLLVENNVLTKATAEQNGEDILLMTSPDRIEHAFSCLPQDVGLLMDVAHFAVSAKTLGFDSCSSLHRLRRLIGGYHLSENDSISDSNHPIREDSWFWNFLDLKVPFIALEIDPHKVGSLADQVRLVEEQLRVNSHGRV